MVLDKETFMSKINEIVGEDTSDKTMTFIEDMTDTYNDLESKSSIDKNEEWEQKYNDLDKSWREKYKARFFDTDSTPDEALNNQIENIENDGEEKTFDDLFTEREG